MCPVNKAIWIDSNNELSLRLITNTYQPTGTQVLVKVEFSGINPADIKHGSHLGLNNYPSGYEYSGEVIAVGSGAKYAVGDLICGHNHAGRGKPTYHGAHQDILIGEHAIFKIPANVPLPAAACMGIVVSTAADALFNQLELPDGTPLAHNQSQASPPGPLPLLIWGGSSGVGIAAIQLAKAAGISPILATASKRNHEVLRSIGASACFDYRDADVTAQIKLWLKENGLPPLTAIFDTVCSPGPKPSTELCEESAETDHVRFACTLPQPGKEKWKMVLATRDVGFPMPILPGRGVIMISPNGVWHERINSAMEWCLSHYGEGNGFIIPKVTVVNGAEKSMEVMKSVADGKSSLEKFAIQHPL